MLGGRLVSRGVQSRSRSRDLASPTSLFFRFRLLPLLFFCIVLFFFFFSSPRASPCSFRSSFFYSPLSRRAAGCRTWPTRSGQCRPRTGLRERRRSFRLSTRFAAATTLERDLNRLPSFLAFTARAWPSAAGGEQRPVTETQPRRRESKERARQRRKRDAKPGNVTPSR